MQVIANPVQEKVFGFPMLRDSDQCGRAKSRSPRPEEFHRGLSEQDVEKTQESAKDEKVRDLKSKNERLFFETFIYRGLLKHRGSLLNQASDERHDGACAEAHDGTDDGEKQMRPRVGVTGEIAESREYETKGGYKR